jgi:protein-S-isoprenylcysteine O-methyltransferase Ste14
MNRSAKFFILIIAPALAMVLALLGVETLPENPLGWFLLLVGVVYIAGLIIVFAIRKERFWESAASGPETHAERSDRSFWAVTLGMLAVFYLSPVEYIYLTPGIPRSDWLAFSGAALVTLGTALFVWARRTLGANYSGHVATKAGQTLVQSGPYRFIRHPAYAGYLLMALGISLGYASLAGLGALLVLLLPSLIYRISLEDKLLGKHFGADYHQYARVTKRLIPGIW